MVGVHVSSSYNHPILGPGGGTRAENRSNHSAAPANFRQKASCVSQKDTLHSIWFLLRPGHPMSTHHHVHHTLAMHGTEEYLARRTHTTIQSGSRVVSSPFEWIDNEVNRVKCKKQICPTGFLTRLYYVYQYMQRRSWELQPVMSKLQKKFHI
jgi:hypothetical protein